jgi:aspartyl-tRNA(Asn)/glutamyl-tRNA(Gln) amidotransferase subunit A
MTPEEARRRAREFSDLNAFISFTEEQGDGPAVAVKDLIDVKGTVTTGGSSLLPDSPSQVDAQVIIELRKYGCSVMGKTNLHEWALGATSNNRHFGPVRNPLDPRRVAGGSSGGSAAAVAAGMCDWAIGTDTAGSIRIPAALCGVVGLRPTVGTVSTEGVVPLSFTLDTVGPLAKDVPTLASAFELMSGRRLRQKDIPSLESWKLAVPSGWVIDLDHEVQSAWTSETKDLPEINFPERRRLYECTTTIVLKEAARFHRRMVEDAAERYDLSILADIQMGLELSSESYVAALSEKRRMDHEIEEALADWDALIIPTTSCVAPLLEESGTAREKLNRFTRPLSLSGHPVITLPMPTAGDLPIGVQIFGKFGQDADLLRIAAAFETSWNDRAWQSNQAIGEP